MFSVCVRERERQSIPSVFWTVGQVCECDCTRYNRSLEIFFFKEAKKKIAAYRNRQPPVLIHSLHPLTVSLWCKCSKVRLNRLIAQKSDINRLISERYLTHTEFGNHNSVKSLNKCLPSGKNTVSGGREWVLVCARCQWPLHVWGFLSVFQMPVALHMCVFDFDFLGDSSVSVRVCVLSVRVCACGAQTSEC